MGAGAEFAIFESFLWHLLENARFALKHSLRISGRRNRGGEAVDGEKEREEKNPSTMLDM